MKAYDDVIASEKSFHNKRFAEGDSRISQKKYYWAVENGFAHFDSHVNQAAVDADILMYGCGADLNSSRLAPVAKSVVGIDISEEAIKQQIDHCDYANVTYKVMDAMHMDFEDESFDLVYGLGILHHLDTHAASKEIARVLRKGGTALFWEPLGINPAFNLYRAATPAARTIDEHPFKLQDFAIMREYFSDVDTKFFGLTTLAAVPFRDFPAGVSFRRTLERIDSAVFNLPGLRFLSWCSVIRLTKGA
jgi:SAM-dependent methyltransferase